ncbi:unnamed protein product [Dibothriocephalus latus]|uniref:Ig-like domain-containing protein n=1 Tax=Dibothriocephalus latus TaxID=60516 RepID=A0A3P7KZE6_DIBLA|nr:unnamed protein product [Dibothriocephalus latus]
MEHRRPFYAECRLSPRPSVPVDYTWYFQGRVFSRGERLSIPELNENTVGDYTCQARFRPTGGSTVEGKATISLRYNFIPADSLTGQFVVSIVPLTQQMEHRRPFYADCRLSPRPSAPVDYTWYFQGRVFSRGERLRIPELNDHSVGDYTCQVRFRQAGGSTIEGKAIISLQYNSFPSVSLTDPQTYRVSINPLIGRPARGSPFYADCHLQPQPPHPVRLTWYFKGRYHSEGQRLSIHELNENTIGEYTCQATITTPTGTPMTVNVTMPIYYAAAPSPDPAGKLFLHVQPSIVP